MYPSFETATRGFEPRPPRLRVDVLTTMVLRDGIISSQSPKKYSV